MKQKAADCIKEREIWAAVHNLADLKSPQGQIKHGQWHFKCNNLSPVFQVI